MFNKWSRICILLYQPLLLLLLQSVSSTTNPISPRCYVRPFHWCATKFNSNILQRVIDWLCVLWFWNGKDASRVRARALDRLELELSQFNNLLQPSLPPFCMLVTITHIDQSIGTAGQNRLMAWRIGTNTRLRIHPPCLPPIALFLLHWCGLAYVWYFMSSVRSFVRLFFFSFFFFGCFLLLLKCSLE